jgi:hypothetical protein
MEAASERARGAAARARGGRNGNGGSRGGDCGLGFLVFSSRASAMDWNLDASVS